MNAQRFILISHYVNSVNEEIPQKNDKSILAEFIRNNQSIFTVMGIFAAISIYLTQISSDEKISESERYYLSFGVVASFFFIYLILLDNFN